MAHEIFNIVFRKVPEQLNGDEAVTLFWAASECLFRDFRREITLLPFD